MATPKIPVLMYHSVGIPNPKWIWNFLTVPYAIFEDHLRMLRKKGFNTIDLSQLYDYVSSGKLIPPNSVVLTFDDGYLDNWVYAYPLLKKYGFKGTIFVNPEFVDPTEDYRPNLEDVWAGKVRPEEMTSNGFLSWREMKEMGKDGIMDMQSHGMTHTWYFTGPEIVDFRHPGDSYIWMNWNKDISRKHEYLTETQDDLIELGDPVYKHEKSLSGRRYFPDESLREGVVRYVKENGGIAFFKNKSWRKILFEVAEDYKRKNVLTDRYESEEEQINRFEWELRESKNILEKQLEKRVSFFCWPGGGYNSYSRNIANNYYTSNTLASGDQSEKRNIPGENPKEIKRIGIPYIEKTQSKPLRYLGGYHLFLSTKEFEGDFRRKTLRKLLKAASLLRHRYL
jgi:peptidoglycan/xylan/chitin deacetylase (PgdA/CDA1 family)